MNSKNVFGPSVALYGLGTDNVAYQRMVEADFATGAAGGRKLDFGTAVVSICDGPLLA